MHRPWLVAAVIVLAAAAVGGTYLSASGRSAPAPGRGPQALLLVAPRSSSLVPGPAPTPAEVEAYRRTQAALLKSEFVLNAALRAPAVQEAVRPHSDPVAWLAEHLTAEYGEGNDVLRVGVAGLPPLAAAAVANAVAEAYLQESAQVAVRAAQEHRRRLEDAQQVLRQRAAAKRAELVAQAQAVGLPPDAADHRAAMAALYQERSALRIEAAKSKAAGKSFQDELAALDQTIHRAEQGGAALDGLRAEIARLESAADTLAAEQFRVEAELGAPPRVRLVQRAGGGDKP